MVYPVERVEVRDPHRGPLPWLGYIALRVLQGTVGRLPRALRNGLGRVLVTIIAPLDRRHTRAALDFVRSAFLEYSEREAKALVRSAWLHLWDLTLRAPYAAGEILHKPLGDAFRVSMDPRAQELAAAGGPVVFVGCHVGHWELAGIALATLGFQPIYAVGKAPRNDYLSPFDAKGARAQERTHAAAQGRDEECARRVARRGIGDLPARPPRAQQTGLRALLRPPRRLRTQRLGALPSPRRADRLLRVLRRRRP
ncbi:MAG: hypothetical protein R3E96_16640 [Planctomycetota bacterium]